METDKQLFYKEGYKYQTSREYHVATGIKIPAPAKTDWLDMDVNGNLTIKKGYAWDGCSGPTWDDSTNLRGSCIHDSGYQLIRLGLIPEPTRKQWDLTFQRSCRTDGMAKLRAWYYFEGVRNFAEFATDAKREPKELHAP